MKKRIWMLTASTVLALSALAANIQTDRTWYLAGEAMTVGVKADDAAVAYIELCDTHGMMAGATVCLRAGTGTGILQLPADLHSGYYALTVYTRNAATASRRLVAVVNALRKSTADDIQWMPADSCWAEGAAPHTGSDPAHTGSDPAVRPASHEGQTPCEQTVEKPADLSETEGHIVKARVSPSYGGHTFSASQITPALSIIGKQIHYFEGKMVNDSLALFFTYGVYGRQPLVLAATTATGEHLPVELISPFEALLPKSLPHLVFHYSRSQVEARSLAMQRRQMAMANSGAVAPSVYCDTAFGTKPHPTYNLDEYRQFLTVGEVMLEYVSCVRNTKVNGVPRLIVRNEDDPYDSSLPTLVLIDGMPVSDVERLLGYDARRVHHINIYGGQYSFGRGVYNGILSFVTRSGQLTNYPTEPQMQYLLYEFPK